ncbi:MAG: alpha-amylase family glycosyl hydrolase, partial [Cyanobacteria bacterium P01_D01_bin.2]
AVMNYLFTGPVLAFAAGDRVVMEYVERPDYYPYPALDAQGYTDKIQALLDLYDWEIHQVQLNLLSSHDIARALSVVGDNVASLELAVVLQMTFPGAPCIYYGDEVGLSGGLDPENRRGFPPEADWHQGLLKTHRALIRLRHLYPALRTGTYQVLSASGQLLVFARTLSEQTVIVAVNTGDQPEHSSLSLAAIALQSPPAKQLYGSGKMALTGDRLDMTLPAQSALIVG